MVGPSIALRGSNRALALQLGFGLASAVAIIWLVGSSGSLSGRVIAAVATAAIAAALWKGIYRGRTHHRLTDDVLSIRSSGFTKDIPTRDIAGIGLIRGELKSAFKAYPSWTPLVWDREGKGYRLLGIVALERRRSNRELLQTPPGCVATRIFERIADVQGDDGPLVQHQVLPRAAGQPFIEILLGNSSGLRFRRWNPDTGWEPIDQ